MKKLKIFLLWLFAPLLVVPILGPVFGTGYCCLRAEKWLDSCIHWHISDNETLTRVWECRYYVDDLTYRIDSLTAILHITAWVWLALLSLLLVPVVLWICSYLANKLELGYDD